MLAHDPKINSASGLKPILDTALDAVIVMELDGRVSDWNAVAERTFGWSHAEAVGRMLSDLIIPYRYRAAHTEGLKRYIDSGHGPVLNRRIEITALHRNETEFPVELAITPTHDQDRPVFLGFVRDISDRRRSAMVLERKAIETEMLSRITALTAETESFEDALRICLSSICEMTGWPGGHAFIVDEADPDRLVSTGLWHERKGVQFDALRKATAAFEFTKGMGLPGIIFETEEPMWISNIKDDPRFLRGRWAAQCGAESAFGFPIKTGGKVIAVLEFFSNALTEPDPDLLLTVRTIGQQVGRVFERKRADDLLRREKQALEAEIAERKRIEQHLQLLLAELNHRVKNMLSVVMGMASQTARTSPSIETFTESFLGRLSSLGRTYSLLTAQNWQRAPLRTLVEDALDFYVSTPDPRVSITGPDMMLEPRAALAISLIVHELTTNAVKHGALAVPTGHIAILWEASPGAKGQHVVFTWRESGVPGTKPPTRTGFGTRMIEASARHELGGKAQMRWHSDGMECLIEFDMRFINSGNGDGQRISY